MIVATFNEGECCLILGHKAGRNVRLTGWHGGSLLAAFYYCGNNHLTMCVSYLPLQNRPGTSLSWIAGKREQPLKVG